MYKFQVIGSQSKHIFFESESKAAVFRWLQISYPACVQGNKELEALRVKKIFPDKLVGIE